MLRSAVQDPVEYVPVMFGAHYYELLLGVGQ